MFEFEMIEFNFLPLMLIALPVLFGFLFGIYIKFMPNLFITLTLLSITGYPLLFGAGLVSIIDVFTSAILFEVAILFTIMLWATMFGKYLKNRGKPVFAS